MNTRCNFATRIDAACILLDLYQPNAVCIYNNQIDRACSLHRREYPITQTQEMLCANQFAHVAVDMLLVRQFVSLLFNRLDDATYQRRGRVLQCADAPHATDHRAKHLDVPLRHRRQRDIEILLDRPRIDQRPEERG